MSWIFRYRIVFLNVILVWPLAVYCGESWYSDIVLLWLYLGGVHGVRLHCSSGPAHPAAQAALPRLQRICRLWSWQDCHQENAANIVQNRPNLLHLHTHIPYKQTNTFPPSIWSFISLVFLMLEGWEDVLIVANNSDKYYPFKLPTRFFFLVGGIGIFCFNFFMSDWKAHKVFDIAVTGMNI